MPDEFEFEIPQDATPQEPAPVAPPVPELIEPEPHCHLTASIDMPAGPVATEAIYRFSLPPTPRATLMHQLKVANAGIIPHKDTPEFAEWKETMEGAVENYTPGSLYQDRLDDPTADFTQGVRKPDGTLHGIASPKFRTSQNELKGELAVLKISKKIGVGDVLTIPLPHSGIWVTVKPPTERDIIDFYNTTFREKIYLGRMSAGLTLTNLSAYINNRLFDFIVKHVHSVNYGDISKDQLKNYVLVHDFHVLAWGFAATMYPSGFDYQRPCSNRIESCSYIAKDVINMHKLLWVDNSSLTEAQKGILNEVRPGKLTTESYRKYISEHSRTKSSEIILNNDIRITLKVPTVAEHISDGLGWVNKINASIDSVMALEGDDAVVKKEMLQQYVSSSVLRQFSHFIDIVEVDGEPISDREAIHSVLEAMSADDTIRANLTKAILQFKADTTLALVGIPQYTCPKCDTNQNPEPVNGRFTRVIPLDVMLLFFTLLTLRMSRILERQ